MNTKEKPYWQRILVIASPIIVANIVSQLQMLIDKMFLGRLSLEAMSAVGNATSPIWTTMNTIFSLTMGGTILASQAIGEGNPDKAKSILASVFKFNSILAMIWFAFWALCGPLVFTLMGVDASIMEMTVTYARIFAPIFILCGLEASYMSLFQVSERTTILMGYGIVRSVTNIFLDYCLIFGHFGMPRLEVSGAALATTASEFIGFFIIFVYVLFAKKNTYAPKLSEIVKAKFSTYWDTIKMGWPTACEEFAWNFGSLFLIAMLNQVSAIAAGIYSLVFSVELIPVSVLGGLGAATLTLSGQEAGRKNPKGMKSIVYNACAMAGVTALFMLVCFRLFPEVIMGWFTTDQSVILASVVYLTIVGIDLFPKGLNIIVGDGIKGYGDTRWMLMTQIIGTIFIMSSSMILVKVFHLGITALFLLVVADETLRCTLNYMHFRKITGKNAITPEPITE